MQTPAPAGTLPANPWAPRKTLAFEFPICFQCSWPTMEKDLLLTWFVKALPNTSQTRLARRAVQIGQVLQRWLSSCRICTRTTLFGLFCLLCLLSPLTISNICFAANTSHQASTSTSTNALDIASTPPQAVPLKSYFTQLEDAERKLSVADVVQADLQGLFQATASQRNALSFGYTRSAFWLRLQLKNSSAQEVMRMLEIQNPRLADVQLHIVQDKGGFASVFTGNAMPFMTRPHKNRHFVFPIKLAAQAEITLFLRLESYAPMLVPAYLWHETQYLQHERADYALNALYFGIGSAMILFNLLLFFALRDMLYILYVNFSCWMMLAVAVQNGLAKEFLWQNSPFLSSIAGSVSIAMAMAGIVLFQRRMLGTFAQMPKIDKFLMVIFAIHLSSCVAYALWLPQTMQIATIVNSIAAFGSHFVAVYLAFKGLRSAIFFVSAFAFLFIGGFARVMYLIGWLEQNQFTTYGMQFGSALEMLLLAFALADRLNLILRAKENAQQAAFVAQTKLLENLQSSESSLEERVKLRTAEISQSNAALSSANAELNAAYQSAEIARQQAEQAQRAVTNTMIELRSFETQLVQAEKMASLGQLIAGVAHEINAPISTIKSSGKNISDAINQTISSTPSLFQGLAQEHWRLYLRLLHGVSNRPLARSTREERAITRELTQRMEAAHIPEARHKAGIFVQLNAHQNMTEYLPLLLHPRCDALLETAHSVTTIVSSVHNINIAVDRVSKIILALKSFSHFDPSEKRISADLRDGLETILTIYHSQLSQEVELSCQFDSIEPIYCLPDELNQVWTELIQNALRAMQGRSERRLKIGLHRVGDEAEISFADTGCGIAAEHQEKIFDAFFTTKGGAEGCGLGLNIVKKIIDKHRGRILVRSEVDHGTCILIYLPYLLSLADTAETNSVTPPLKVSS